MKLVVFGLTISSSWGNGHATLWRGLVGALARRGWRVIFFERDVSYYAGARDMWEIDGGELVLYRDWNDVSLRARRHLAEADAAIVTSYCPDGLAATDLVLDAGAPIKVFYDLDTPVTLSRLSGGERLSYIGPDGLSGFDLVLSFTGGEALDRLATQLGAKRVLPLYGHADPNVHSPVEADPDWASDLSYLGTFSPDRQKSLMELLLRPARARPAMRFLMAGAQYPDEFPWLPNLYFMRHLEPAAHPRFYCSSRLTLNVTRKPMADMGWCPSGRLFEAAACGVPVLSDRWEGLDTFFEPGEEILVADDRDDVLAALDRGPDEARRIGRRARERLLDEHTSDHRAATFEAYLSGARHPAESRAEHIHAET